MNGKTSKRKNSFFRNKSIRGEIGRTEVRSAVRRAERHPPPMKDSARHPPRIRSISDIFNAPQPPLPAREGPRQFHRSTSHSPQHAGGRARTTHVWSIATMAPSVYASAPMKRTRRRKLAATRSVFMIVHDVFLPLTFKIPEYSSCAARHRHQQPGNVNMCKSTLPALQKFGNVP